jgi:hypothetical protein
MNPNSELPDGSLTSVNFFLIGAFHVRSAFGGFSAMLSPGLNRGLLSLAVWGRPAITA